MTTRENKNIDTNFYTFRNTFWAQALQVIAAFEGFINVPSKKKKKLKKIDVPQKRKC